MYVNFESWGCVFHQFSLCVFLFFSFFPLKASASFLPWFKECTLHTHSSPWLELAPGAWALEFPLFWIHAPGKLCNQWAQASWHFSFPGNKNPEGRVHGGQRLKDIEQISLSFFFPLQFPDGLSQDGCYSSCHHIDIPGGMNKKEKWQCGTKGGKQKGKLLPFYGICLKALPDNVAAQMRDGGGKTKEKYVPHGWKTCRFYQLGVLEWGRWGDGVERVQFSPSACSVKSSLLLFLRTVSYVHIIQCTPLSLTCPPSPVGAGGTSGGMTHRCAPVSAFPWRRQTKAINGARGWF